MQEKTVNSPEETAKKQDTAEIQKDAVNWNGYTPPPYSPEELQSGRYSSERPRTYNRTLSLDVGDG